jgi:DNA invertase Pin-like site-specific DNA recombinase
MKNQLPQKRFVAYYRVSTDKQARSGLGLEAQQDIVRQYTSGRGSILNEFIEVESGKNKERPQLQKAMEVCKQERATLVIAKLDRLSRSVSFIFALKESQIDFECCDLPDLNTLNLGIFATIAQHEAELTSQRTKDALRVKKMQGFKLGTPENLTQEARGKGCLVRKKLAQENPKNKNAFKFARDCRDKGESYGKIADKLNNYGFESPKGAKFYGCSVRNLFKLYQELA